MTMVGFRLDFRALVGQPTLLLLDHSHGVLDEFVDGPIGTALWMSSWISLPTRGEGGRPYQHLKERSKGKPILPRLCIAANGD
jgi:hypothetical protein